MNYQSKWHDSSRGREYTNGSNANNDQQSGRQGQGRPSFQNYRNQFGKADRSAGRSEYERVDYRQPRTQRNERSTRYASADHAERADRSAQRQYRPSEGHQQSASRYQATEERTFRPRYNQNNYSQRKRREYQERIEDPNKEIRLNKFLANAGICSRREADDFIQAGVVTVNGEVVAELGAKVKPTDNVMFHNQPVRRERKVYILLNKPKNTVTTTDDPQERQTVIDIVQNACNERIYPVGRLDRNTTGVLLLTNDGDLAAKLTHPKYGKKKIYAATLDKDLAEEDYATIMHGIMLDDELIVPDAMEYTREDDRKHIGLEIHSGQNRVVRRIFEKVGYKVMQLDRVSFAGLTKKNVPRGKYRFLTPKEVAMLKMGAFE